ncbi:MAG: tetratricopeptide repeat protein [Rhodocyclaceae bacterium]|nr:tetratricopeptide repeat protein [Rhodocyclaceae bacterium]
MAAYDLEEQEKIDELKTWWKLHGAKVTAVLLACAIGMVGWQAWQWWERRQAMEAGALYWALQEAVTMQDTKRARMIAGELIDKYARTAYAGMGALLSGKVLAESGDLKSAQAQFGWAAEHAREPGLQDLARLRQAAALADAGALEEALRVLERQAPQPALKPRFFEAKGDILAALGKSAQARSAYEEAEKALMGSRNDLYGAPTDQYAEILAVKRLVLGSPQ